MRHTRRLFRDERSRDCKTFTCAPRVTVQVTGTHIVVNAAPHSPGRAEYRCENFTITPSTDGLFVLYVLFVFNGRASPPFVFYRTAAAVGNPTNLTTRTNVIRVSYTVNRAVNLFMRVVMMSAADHRTTAILPIYILLFNLVSQ